MSEPAETIETESKELMPMEAFEAMADALRPLASGLEDFTVGSRVFSCFVAGDREDSALTKEGEHRITEMSSIAAEQARRLVDVESSHLITYLPRWCEQELSAVRALVERIAWIMYGAAEGALGPANNSPPEHLQWAAVHGFDMAQEAYNDLCGKLDEYTAAEGVAINQQYEDMGYIKQPNGEWHPTPEMLTEMGAAS